MVIGGQTLRNIARRRGRSRPPDRHGGRLLLAKLTHRHKPFGRGVAAAWRGFMAEGLYRTCEREKQKGQRNEKHPRKGEFCAKVSEFYVRVASIPSVYDQICRILN
jgi:hypothetical protein